MSEVTIEFNWKIRGPLHVGTGLSRIGDADRLIRLSADDSPYIPGEAVKGAVRGAAERLARWLGADVKAGESDADSTPKHPMLRRLFSPHAEALYRFSPAVLRSPSTKPVALPSTAIDHETGTALDHTLRLVESLRGGAVFRARVMYRGVTPPERQDCIFLMAAITATDAIGGKKGIGWGQVECQGVQLIGDVNGSPGWKDLTDVQVLEELRQELARAA